MQSLKSIRLAEVDNFFKQSFEQKKLIPLYTFCIPFDGIIYFLDGMLTSGCEFRKLIPKRSLKRSIETESERNSVDHFRKVHSLVQW